jgi:hypothetical protein
MLAKLDVRQLRTSDSMHGFYCLVSILELHGEQEKPSIETKVGVCLYVCRSKPVVPVCGFVL